MAECCKISGGIDKGVCGLAKGGLKGTFYAANYCEIATYVKTGKLVTAVTMDVDPLTSSPFYWFPISFKANSAGFNNEAQIGNNTFVNHSLTFSTEGLTVASLTILEEMMTAELVFIVTDARGVNHLLGRLEGMKLSSGVVGAGVTADDIYGATLTFTSGEVELSNIVQSGVIIDVWDGASVVPITLP